eukprot:COSAG01_NODE_4433_length_5029_cov_21.493103_7_plen_71_part_00
MLAALVVASQRDMAVEKEAEGGVGTAVGVDAVGERAGGGAGKPHMNRRGGGGSVGAAGELGVAALSPADR